MIIPKPVSLVLHDGIFILNDELKIVCDASKQEVAFISELLSQRITAIAGLTVETIAPSGRAPVRGNSSTVVLELGEPEASPNPEAYHLRVERHAVTVRAPEPAGLFYAIQTLCKLLMSNDGGRTYVIPCLEMRDAPVFEWRGLLLDCCRHFLSVDYIKHCIDCMAELKMNRLHLHLTDNEGWRLEISKYPELTRTGAYVDDPGFYTQADIREIIHYAQERFVTVVPEVDVPGHALAALRGYPWLCCTGAPERNSGHQKDLFCAGNEQVVQFLLDVLDEVIELFPSDYIHLGGDEAPKERWKECEVCQEAIRKHGLGNEEGLQGHLLRTLSEHAARRGKKTIGWDEALECGIHQDMAIQWWRYRNKGDQPAVHALEQNHPVIASPNSLTYLSFPTEPDDHFKPVRTSDLRKAYSAKYVPDGLTEEQRRRVLGAECCIWTEYLTEKEIDRMLFPRVLACAELMWSYPEQRDFSEFLIRVRLEQHRLERAGIHFGPYFSVMEQQS